MGGLHFNEGENDEYNDERILASPDGPVRDGCIRVSPGQGNVDSCAIDRSDENLPRTYGIELAYDWQVILAY